MSWYDEQYKRATDRLTVLLALPMPEEQDDIGREGYFNPWGLFPALYGTYSSDFDECAIAVLVEVYEGRKDRSDLAAEMIREMLCTSHLCTYGTSPRVCFPARQEIKALLPELIEKWTRHSALMWGP